MSQGHRAATAVIIYYFIHHEARIKLDLQFMRHPSAGTDVESVVCSVLTFLDLSVAHKVQDAPGPSFYTFTSTPVIS